MKIKGFWITAWRAPGSTEMKIQSFSITALRALRSTEMKIKSFWITAWRALGSTKMKIQGFWIAALKMLCRIIMRSYFQEIKSEQTDQMRETKARKMQRWGGEAPPRRLA